MEAKAIPLKALLLSIAAVLAAEIGLHAATLWLDNFQMVLLCVARTIEILALIQIARHFTPGLDAIGLALSGILRGFKRGLVWSVGFGLLVLVLYAALMAAGFNPIAYMHFPMPGAPLTIILLFFVGGIVSPVAEEVFFRGILYGFFRKWGITSAVLFSTAIFVLAHGSHSQLPIIQMVGGVLFAASYEIEDSLIAPMTIHILGNLALFALSALSQARILF